MEAKDPICPNCIKPLSPAGGVVGTDLMFWACWDCGYKLEDIEYKIYSKDELTKAENNILNDKQLDLLLGKTPENHIYKRPGKGGGEFRYVTGIYMKKSLNFLFGWDWDFEVMEFDVNMTAMQAIVLGKLTCRTGGKTIVKTQFGRVDIKQKRDGSGILDLGNDLKAAATDALKKCASEIGIASDVYGEKEFKEIKVQPEETFGEKHKEQMKRCKTFDELEIYYDTNLHFVNNPEFIELFKTISNELS